MSRVFRDRIYRIIKITTYNDRNPPISLSYFATIPHT